MLNLFSIGRKKDRRFFLLFITHLIASIYKTYTQTGEKEEETKRRNARIV